MGDVTRFWIRVLEVLSSIQSGTKVTCGVDTRSRVEVLATDEDNSCLGKRDQCREVKDRIGAT